MNLTALCGPLRPKRWICEGLGIEAGTRPNVILGPGGVRKGWFGMGLFLCGAANLPLLGFHLKENLRSIYLDWESTPDTTQERLQLLARGHGVQLGKLDPNCIRYQWQPVFSLAEKDARERERVISTLCRATENTDLAFVDSIFSASGFAQENAGEGSIPLRVMTSVSVRTGVAFIAADHTGWSNQERQRGHSSKEQQTQGVLSMHRHNGRGPTRVHCARNQGISDDRRPDDFSFTLEPASGGVRLVTVGSRRTQTAGSERLEQCKAEVLRLMSEAGAPLSGKRIRALVLGFSNPIKAEALIDLEESGIVRQAGSGKSNVWSMTKSVGKQATGPGKSVCQENSNGGR